MPWWAQLIMALLQALPDVFKFFKNHPDPAQATSDFKSCVGGLCTPEIKK